MTDARVEAAKQEVFRLCREGRWRMTIPVDPAHDSDVLIMNGFRALEAQLAAAEADAAALRAAAGEFLAELERGVATGGEIRSAARLRAALAAPAPSAREEGARP